MSTERPLVPVPERFGKFLNLLTRWTDDGTSRTARHQALVSAIGSGLLLRMVSSVVGVVQTALIIRALGLDLFGYWISVQYIGSFIPVLDIGVGNSLQNKVAACLANGDRFQARRQLDAALFIGITISLLLLSICIPLIVNTDALGKLPVGSEVPVGLKTAVAVIAIGAGVLNIPLGIIVRFVLGYQISWVLNITQLGGSVAGLILVWTAIVAGLNPEVIILMATITPIMPILCVFVWLLDRFPRDAGVRCVANWRTRKDLVAGGLSFVGINVASLLISTLPALWIAGVSSGAYITAYNLVQRIMALAQQLQTAILQPFWAAYTEAWARGDSEWIQKAFRLSLSVNTLLVGSPAVILGLFGSGLIEVWSGQPEGTFDGMMVVAAVLWFVVINMMMPYSFLLNSVGRTRLQGITGFCSILVGGLCGWWCSEFIGGAGILLGLAIGFVVINNPVTIINAHSCARAMNIQR